MMKKNSSNKNLTNKTFLATLIVFFKGLFMGFSDLLPGISGGTIALITGIYQEFINSIRAITQLPFSFLTYISIVLKKQSSFEEKISQQNILKETIKEINIQFFAPLALGIFLAIFLGAHLITFLLKDFYIITMTFFLGVILASIIILYKKVNNHTFFSTLLFILFFLLGTSFIFLKNLSLTTTFWWYYLIIGFIASMAMMLPGISGSFILLIFGAYTTILTAIKQPFSHIPLLIIFAIGIFLGFFVLSKVLIKQFKKNNSQTYMALSGLVLGALIIPIQSITQIPVVWSLTTWIVSLVVFLFACILVLFINSLSKF
jgi:putative membrane protein